MMNLHLARIAHEPNPAVICDFGMETAARTIAFHKSFPEYAPTPLRSLAHLAEYLNVGAVWVKDESLRFGLNAFKALGGSYAIGRCIAERLGVDPEGIDYNVLTDDSVRKRLGRITFITATDGNHGRGVAWTANRMRQGCIVHMPKGSAAERLNNIRALGADADILNLNYDGCVAQAMREARENGYILVQDTAMAGYTKIPRWIMQGYATMGAEAIAQMDGDLPTHLFLQAGVGSMAAAMAALFSDAAARAGRRLTIVIVEPHAANCIFRTAQANDGQLHPVTGDMNTIMAGLACGVPCTTAWDVLKSTTEFYVSMPDCVAARGMRVLGNPMGGDARVISGESGASALGLAVELCTNPDCAEIKKQIGVTPESRILCFSTEGDTDRENYRRIVWDGTYPNA